MSERVAAAKAQQLVSFLAHAHAKHVIHRCVAAATAGRCASSGTSWQRRQQVALHSSQLHASCCGSSRPARMPIPFTTHVCHTPASLLHLPFCCRDIKPENLLLVRQPGAPDGPEGLTLKVSARCSCGVGACA